VRSVNLVQRRDRYYARYYDGSRPEGDRQCTRSLQTERKDVAERRVVERRKEFKEGRLNPWNPNKTTKCGATDVVYLSGRI